MPLPKIKIKKEVNNTGSGKQTSRTLSVENKQGDKGVVIGTTKIKEDSGYKDKRLLIGFSGKKRSGAYETQTAKNDNLKNTNKELRVYSNDKKEKVAGRNVYKHKEDTAFGNGVTSKKTKVSYDKNDNLSKSKQKTTIRINEPSKSSNSYKVKTKMNRFGSKVTTTRKAAVPVKQMKKK